MNSYKKTHPFEIEMTIKSSLSSFLHGHITKEHLARILRQYIQGKRASLSSKLAILYPKFTKLLDLLQGTSANTRHSSINDLADQLLIQLH